MKPLSSRILHPLPFFVAFTLLKPLSFASSDFSALVASSSAEPRRTCAVCGVGLSAVSHIAQIFRNPGEKCSFNYKILENNSMMIFNAKRSKFNSIVSVLDKSPLKSELKTVRIAPKNVFTSKYHARFSPMNVGCLVKTPSPFKLCFFPQVIVFLFLLSFFQQLASHLDQRIHMSEEREKEKEE